MVTSANINGKRDGNMNISIDQKLKELAPNLTLGVVLAFSVSVSKHDISLFKEIRRRSNEIISKIKLETIHDIRELKALRDTYRTLGKDPTRYRGSSEALVRRILQGKDVYQVNTVVDINNLVSLETLHPIGSYNLSELKSPIIFRIGEPGEIYKGIGKDKINIAGLPVLADQIYPFGSPTSDSERTMITLDTKDVMMVIISFTGAHHLTRQIQRIASLLCLYAKASKERIEMFTVE